LSATGGVRISAVCDIDEGALKNAQDKFGVDGGACFADEDKFFAGGKLGDGLVIASMDKDHYRHTIKALDAGYKKILLEKPVSDKPEEIEAIAAAAKNRGADILVCHVLRYTGFYKTIRDIVKSGAIGKVTVINHQENVAYWHFAHSFTRGNWRDENTSAPLLLAKTCHDFDLIYWYADSKCTGAVSYGALSYFRKENAPKDCAARCLDGCKYLQTCPYGVKRLYLDKDTPFKWGIFAAIGKNNPTYEEKVAALKMEDNVYGRCVYLCDNNVADHQSVVMNFENGATAALTVTAFSKDCYRKIHIMGTKGEVYGSDTDKFLVLNVFGAKSKKVKIKSKIAGGHLGGDNGICDTFCKLIRGDAIDPDYLTTIDVTLESHKIIFEAERSRKNAAISND
jgi:predicted dehydrogenase